jgi:hypothetical protein
VKNDDKRSEIPAIFTLIGAAFIAFTTLLIIKIGLVFTVIVLVARPDPLAYRAVVLAADRAPAPAPGAAHAAACSPAAAPGPRARDRVRPDALGPGRRLAVQRPHA